METEIAKTKARLDRENASDTLRYFVSNSKKYLSNELALESQRKL